MLRPLTNRKAIFLLSLALAALYFFRVVSEPYDHESPLFFSSTSRSNVVDLFDFEPADSEAIRKVCQRTKWNENLIFTCDKSGGGVGNLRNSVLNCVRYAIHGGGGLVVPRIIQRSPEDIALIWNRETTEFDYIFDRAHFVESLRRSCPQMEVFNSSADIPTKFPLKNVLSLEPEKELVANIPGNGSWPTEVWRGLFYKWLDGKSSPGNGAVKPGNSTIDPVVVGLGRSYLQYPIYTDGEEFALDFGKILKFRTDARILATTALKSLAREYGIHSDLRKDILGNAFYGIHLRTEKDSRQGWPHELYVYSRYKTQSEYYLAQANSSQTSVIYLASGDPKEVERFTNDAVKYNIKVTTKHDLLTGEDRAGLDKLTFDQQALIDFLVLLKATGFAGVGHSSFAWNIALHRHRFARQRDHLNGPQLMSDELSQVMGTPNMYPEYAPCLWP